jgi:anti-sigma regulatory factor (Ser/Thr protein kinase)
MAIRSSARSATRPPGSSEIRIANRISEIARVVSLVDAFARDNNLSEHTVVALKVALDEILNNIISYGYDDARRHEIMVRLARRRGKIEAVVEDDGKPFDPAAQPAPNLKAEDRVGGVGIHFVRNLTDEMEYARVGAINQLRIAKKI